MALRITPPSANESGADAARRLGLRRKIFAITLAVFVAGAGGIWSLRYEFRSYAFLAQFLSPQASGVIVRVEKHEVQTQEVTLATANGAVRARLYIPRGIARPGGMLLVHGIHHLGIDEPRLVSFARAAASSGFTVLTPEIAALADYHVDGASIGTIGESAAWLEARLETGPVTIVGVSFAGGL